jgi:hypothetical protein
MYHGTGRTVSDGDAGVDAKRAQSFEPPRATRLMWNASVVSAKWGKAMDHLPQNQDPARVISHQPLIACVAPIPSLQQCGPCRSRE